jgi:hypothetical protein
MASVLMAYATKYGFPDANPGTKKLPPVDLRDWPAIEAWAESLPEALGLAGGVVRRDRAHVPAGDVN